MYAIFHVCNFEASVITYLQSFIKKRNIFAASAIFTIKPIGMKNYHHILFILLLSITAHTTHAQVYKAALPLAHTFSIVARDSATGQMAVGVQSHWFSVGTSVSWAESGVGAIATQSFIDKSYGTKGLALLKQGYTAQQALDSLLKQDSSREVRQVAFIDTKGNVASFTGKNCIQYASHIKGSSFSVQSNMMLTNDVCKAWQQLILHRPANHLQKECWRR